MLSSSDKVSPGEAWRPSARAHNAFVDASRQLSQLSIQPGKNKRAGDHLEIYVASEADVLSGTVVGFGDPAHIPDDIGSAQDLVIFEEAAPTAGRFAVPKGGIYAGATGACVLVGVAWANVNILNAANTHADIVAGVLTGGSSGYAKILYKPLGTGTQLCCLYLGCCEGSAGVAGGGPAASHACVCALITILEDEGAISEAAATQAREDCSCIMTHTCSGFEVADTYLFQVPTLNLDPATAAITDADWVQLQQILSDGVLVPSTADCVFEYFNSGILDVSSHQLSVGLVFSAGPQVDIDLTFDVQNNGPPITSLEVQLVTGSVALDPLVMQSYPGQTYSVITDLPTPAGSQGGPDTSATLTFNLTPQ